MLDLPWLIGQTITVYGEIGADLFYYGEYKGRRGVVASNLINEIPSEVW